MSISLKKYAKKYFGDFLEDNEILEIAYNGGDSIFTQNYKGEWKEHITLLNFDSSFAFATSAASFKEDVIKETKSILSAILVNGERTQIVIPPATKKDIISITIRKPSNTRYTLDDYKKQGMFKELIQIKDNETNPKDQELLEHYEKKEIEQFLKKAVEYGKNIVIAGETGSGKTTFMKSLIDFIPEDERIITIEDVEEIKFTKHKNYVQLFYPSEAKEGDFLTSASLLKSCLRMRPDRILLAELRGAETYDFINVLSSGHGGSMTSCHAGSVNETFTRLGLMTLQNPQGQKLPFEIIQKNLKDVIDIVVHMTAHKGKRVITDIYFKGANNVSSK
ncbi:P-type DNA transfer ATPase VirB11 [Halarcobacter mediterraneus]|uniref:P-type DNA transfer ATPase VirB11 n=1 Tax=Halarcobacter mediterraneus TaxID=2023153 RepID=A0A4Q1B4R4_9BACT|nr:P-type DNA transfer ATPase VirB11 [Halarcobacter mediterraneus]RXK13237.1 P-type DNA transfer ATPase VirB11 [Halarcobacter mediterraneus]